MLKFEQDAAAIMLHLQESFETYSNCDGMWFV